MPSKNGPRGEVIAIDGDGQQVVIPVFWRRGSTYLSYNGREHLVHKSNLRRADGFSLEAMIAYPVSGASYRAY